jgi:hypothetical protein
VEALLRELFWNPPGPRMIEVAIEKIWALLVAAMDAAQDTKTL